MSKNILVTGSEGYIGSVLVEELVKNGYLVTGIDNCYFEESRDKSRLKNYRLIKEDIRKIDKLDLSPYFAVIHLAALSNDITGDIRPEKTFDINYLSTVRIAQKAKREGVKRFLFSSSCSIYGIAKNGIVDETSRINPLTPYAKAKIAAEIELKKLTDDRFCVGLLRNSTVYGYSPNFRNDLVVNNLVTVALATKKITIMSDGTPWRPLIDVLDLSSIFIKFLEVDPDLINGQVFNIGFNKNNLQVRYIAEKIKKELPESVIIYTHQHGNDVRTYRVNFHKFHKTFPEISQQWPLGKSVKKMIAKLKEKNFNTRDFRTEKYTRLAVLNRLLKSKALDKEFYWTSHG